MYEGYILYVVSSKNFLVGMGLVRPCLAKELLQRKTEFQVMHYEALVGQCMMKL